MKCEVCGKEIDWGSVITTEGYELDSSDRHWYHKSCYDKSIIPPKETYKEINYSTHICPKCGVMYQHEIGKKYTGYCESCVPPQEAKPTEDWVWYHGMSKEDLRITVQQGYLYQRRGEGMSPCTYLAKEQKEAEQYGEVLLKVIYNPTLHPSMNNYNPESWQIRVYEPIFEYKVISNKDEAQPTPEKPEEEYEPPYYPKGKIGEGLPEAESTGVEEIEELEKTDGYLITNGLVDKVQELVRVVNRLAKEIKLKREKDGL